MWHRWRFLRKEWTWSKWFNLTFKDWNIRNTELSWEAISGIEIRRDKGLGKGKNLTREEGTNIDNFTETIDTTRLMRGITVQWIWLFLWTKQAWYIWILGPMHPSDMALGKSPYLLDPHFPICWKGIIISTLKYCKQ